MLYFLLLCIIKHKTIFLAMNRHIPSNTRIILGKRLYWICISMMTVGLFKIDQHNWQCYCNKAIRVRWNVG
jgi:hypothetical protein